LNVFTSNLKKRKEEDAMGTTTTATYAATAPAATNNLGRDKVPWTKDIWDRIDKAVHEEVMRTRVGQKFLPSDR
jgi:hypothetical protein